MVFLEILHHGIGSSLAEYAVARNVTRGVCMAGYFDDIAFGACGFLRKLIKRLPELRRNGHAIHIEKDTDRILHDIIVDRSDALVRGANTCVSPISLTSGHLRNFG